MGIILAFVVFYRVSRHEDEFVFRDKLVQKIVTRMVGMLMGMVAAVDEIGQRFQIFIGQIELETAAVLAGVFPFDGAIDIEGEHLSGGLHENA